MEPFQGNYTKFIMQYAVPVTDEQQKEKQTRVQGAAFNLECELAINILHSVLHTSLSMFEFF